MQRTWVEIDQEALMTNIEQIRSILADGTDFCAVVKSNAYGHDLKLMSQLCSNAGIDTFMVNSIEEGEVIRKAYLHARIYLWNWIDLDPQKISVLPANYILPVYEPEQLNLLHTIAKSASKLIPINLIINTGMNRLGIHYSKLEPILRTLIQYEQTLNLHAVSSHFSRSDESTETFSEQQYDRFINAITPFYQNKMAPKYVHIANSAGTLKSADYHCNMVRIGALMYGLWPSEYIEKRAKITHNLNLKPVLSWKTSIIQIRDVQKGESLGYNQAHTCDTNTRVATLPIGYFDGALSGRGKQDQVLIRGRHCRILSVTMNLMLVDVSQIANVVVGDHATIIGRSGMNELPAKWNSLDTRAVTTSIHPSIPRIVV